MLVFGCEVWSKGLKEEERTVEIARERKMISENRYSAELYRRKLLERYLRASYTAVNSQVDACLWA